MKNRNICNCNEVSEREVLNAIKRKNARKVVDVSKLTRAGTDCGRCKPTIQAILDREIPQLPKEANQASLF